MEINNIPIPVVPEVKAEPPRDAQLQTAVPEAAQGESAQNNPQADTGGNGTPGGSHDESATVGRYVDERV
ncbi:hypothetical protein MNBD_GAMMA19-1288 [hydrothermal vent metagenome]|uniref:Uncharacterized protein n=1 Tax=hydrothermal vent metagenome TaxID=652676 RepID=A0A3B1AEL7_9ZZZZ